MYEELVFQFNHKLFLTLNDTLKPSKPNCMIAIIEYKMCINPPAIVRTTADLSSKNTGCAQK